jgi:hypothetical protein
MQSGAKKGENFLRRVLHYCRVNIGSISREHEDKPPSGTRTHSLEMTITGLTAVNRSLARYHCATEFEVRETLFKVA